MSQDVRPSVIRRYSIEMDKRIVILLSSLGSHTILVFPHQTAWHIPTGTAKGVIECRGVLKTAVFGEYLNFLSEMIQDIIIVTMQCE